MTSREKVILGLVGVAAIGAGIKYAFESFASPDNIPRRVRADHSNLMITVQAGLQKGELTGREVRVLEAAAAQWVRDPLHERPLSPKKADSSPQSPLPKYIGYINTGSKAIAIIDGNDYRPGEPLLGGVFQLLNIYPDHIELLRRGASDSVDVPLEKPQFTQPTQ